MSRYLYSGSIETNSGAVLKEVAAMKTIVVRVFQKHCENVKFMVNFHLLHHRTTRPEHVETLDMLDCYLTIRSI